MNDLRFNLTKKMAKILKNILIINELLKGDIVDKLEKEKLEKEKNKLVKEFIKEFQKNNKEQIEAYKNMEDTIS